MNRRTTKPSNGMFKPEVMSYKRLPTYIDVYKHLEFI